MTREEEDWEETVGRKSWSDWDMSGSVPGLSFRRSLLKIVIRSFKIMIVIMT